MKPESIQQDRVAAVFDFDSTISRWDTYLPLVLYSRVTGFMDLGWREISGSFIRFQQGKISNKGLKETFLESIAGRSEQELSGFLKDFFTRVVTPLLDPVVLRRVREHRHRGELTLLASASFQPLLELAAQEIGIDHVLGTVPEVVDGRLTGRIQGPNCYGADKLSLVEEWLAARGASLAAATSYSDSSSDLHLLAASGKAVVVRPDKSLRAAAMRAGWEILESGPGLSGRLLRYLPAR